MNEETGFQTLDNRQHRAMIPELRKTYFTTALPLGPKSKFQHRKVSLIQNNKPRAVVFCLFLSVCLFVCLRSSLTGQRQERLELGLQDVVREGRCPDKTVSESCIKGHMSFEVNRKLCIHRSGFSEIRQRIAIG